MKNRRQNELEKEVILKTYIKNIGKKENEAENCIIEIRAASSYLKETHKHLYKQFKRNKKKKQK